jgi:signal transduction histidine kinase
VVIDNVSDDPQYRDHHTPRIYRFESYISVPIFRTDGRFFGTICALDPNPAQLKASAIQSTMESFARVLALQIEAEENQQQTETALAQERQTGVLREQFIAVLGHDLRNPLFAIGASAEMLLRKFPNPPSDELVQHILTSARRASRLVNDVLDFTRGSLGKGIPVNIQPCADLEDALRHVIAEIHSVNPDRQFVSSIGDLRGVPCDRERMTQLASNLVANAVTHGDRTGSVEVDARIEHDAFVLEVSNQGQIDPQALPHLFRPYAAANWRWLATRRAARRSPSACPSVKR